MGSALSTTRAGGKRRYRVAAPEYGSHSLAVFERRAAPSPVHTHAEAPVTVTHSPKHNEPIPLLFFSGGDEFLEDGSRYNPAVISFIRDEWIHGQMRERCVGDSWLVRPTRVLWRPSATGGRAVRRGGPRARVSLPSPQP